MAHRFDRITTDPARMNGQPCIRGMRITARRVVAAVALYPDRDELKREYPELEDEDIRQALEYAAECIADEILALHALIAVSGTPRPTVIRIRREGLNGAEIAALIADVLVRLPEAIAQGALITVTERNIRVRHLPIERPSPTGRREAQS